MAHAVCHACGSTELTHLDEVTLHDRNDTPQGFDAYECKCGEVTLVCYDSKEKVLEIADGSH